MILTTKTESLEGEEYLDRIRIELKNRRQEFTCIESRLS